MTAPPSVRLAVMEDDTVLCSGCVDELHAEGVCETAGTIVHAWLADPVGQACACCGVTDGEGQETGR